jgi:hypothetical protein
MEASVAAAWQLVHLHVTHGRMRALPMVAGHAAYLLLAPTLGPENASRRIIGARSARA